jgi:hypothetical protein
MDIGDGVDMSGFGWYDGDFCTCEPGEPECEYCRQRKIERLELIAEATQLAKELKLTPPDLDKMSNRPIIEYILKLKV